MSKVPKLIVKSDIVPTEEFIVLNCELFMMSAVSELSAICLFRIPVACLEAQQWVGASLKWKSSHLEHVKGIALGT